MDLKQHLIRQISFSRATFGPGARTQGVIDHIQKEIIEVETASNSSERTAEWTDLVILALDGLTREIQNTALGVMRADKAAEIAVTSILEKQGKNEIRDWPDWRTADPNKAIEHHRSGDQEHQAVLDAIKEL